MHCLLWRKTAFIRTLAHISRVTSAWWNYKGNHVRLTVRHWPLKADVGLCAVSGVGATVIWWRQSNVVSWDSQHRRINYHCMAEALPLLHQIKVRPSRCFTIIERHCNLIAITLFFRYFHKSNLTVIWTKNKEICYLVSWPEQLYAPTL